MLTQIRWSTYCAWLGAAAIAVPPQNLIRRGHATREPRSAVETRGGDGLAMAQSYPMLGSEARGPRCGMRSPPPSSGDPAALKVEASAVRSVGSIALGLPFPILAAMARGAVPCSGRDRLALGPTARRPHAPPTKVSAQQARWSAQNRCRDWDRLAVRRETTCPRAHQPSTGIC